MSFCCAAEKHFDRARAESDLLLYRRRSVPRITKLMLSELRRRPLERKQLLDIGAGIGAVSAELAASGIASAMVNEVSPAYLEAARTLLAPLYGLRPTQFLLGDFTRIANTLPDADITTLDRVVCCYPDAEALLQAASHRTRELLAFSYPRDRWYVRLFTAYQNYSRRQKGNAFQTFVHSPRQMAATLERAGFVRAATRGTLVWLVDLYQRRAPSEPHPG